MEQTLAEQFFKHCDDEYGCQVENSQECEQIAKKFSIDFSLWVVRNINSEVYSSLKNSHEPHILMSKLLNVWLKL